MEPGGPNPWNPQPILEALAEAIELCGVPHELMTDNETPFVMIVRTMLSRFQRSLAELEIRHIRTQIDTPWTNGKVEAFWATLQAEVLDRQLLVDLAAAEAAVTAYAGYYNYHRLHGELGWQTPAERFDGTPFTDRGFGACRPWRAWPIYSMRSATASLTMRAGLAPPAALRPSWGARPVTADRSSRGIS